MVTRLKASLNALLARKLVVAFLVGSVAAFADAVTGAAQSAQPLTTSLLIAFVIGALAAGVRAVLALSPLSIVPSDAQHSLVGPAPAKRQVTHRMHEMTTASSAKLRVEIVPPPRPPQKRSADSIHVRRLAEQQMKHHRLGRHVEHDERSRRFAVRDTVAPTVPILWPRHGAPLNQGQLGSCTGNAIAGLLNTDPFRAARGGRLLTEKDAVALYELATALDSIAGSYPPDDTGSSGLAACKAAQRLGYISGYKHAFGIAEALAALKTGPVITGVPWYEGFDTPNAGGVVEISGRVRGGHEFEVLGYDPTTDLVTAENSWGKRYGTAGRFHFTSKTWAALLQQQGDVTVPLPKAAPAQ